MIKDYILAPSSPSESESLKLSQESGKGRHPQDCLGEILITLDNTSSETVIFAQNVGTKKSE